MFDLISRDEIPGVILPVDDGPQTGVSNPDTDATDSRLRSP